MSPKRQKFCEEYLVDLNATQAAIRAGFSERTARSQGQRLLTKVDVKEKIAELQEDARKRTEITRDEVLGVLASIIRSDAASFFDEGKIKEFSKLSREQRKAIESVKVTKSGVRELKFSSKLNAVQIINRMLGWDAPQDISIQLESLSDPMLDAIIQRLLTKKE